MSLSVVRVHRMDGTLTLEIQRPEARNALTGGVISELLAGLAEAETEPAVRSVVITGAGEVFSADDRREPDPPDQLYLDYEADGLYTKLLLRLRGLSKPTIAAVNGAALGTGLGLVAGCDLAIASEQATFGVPDLRTGRFPMLAMAPLVSILGPKVAFELLMTGETVAAGQAKALGLVNRVVPPAGFMEEVAGYAASLEGNSPSLVRLGKGAFYTMPGMGYEQALAYLRSMQTVVGSTEDAREGLRASAEQRSPRWTGR